MTIDTPVSHEVRPTPKLIRLVTSFKPRPKTAEDEDVRDRDDHREHPHDHQREDRVLETIARQIAGTPEKEIFRVTFADK